MIVSRTRTLKSLEANIELQTSPFLGYESIKFHYDRRPLNKHNKLEQITYSKRRKVVDITVDC